MNLSVESHSTQTGQPLNVVCALWAATSRAHARKTRRAKAYGHEHVNALQQMIQRNSTVPFQLWCVTNTATRGRLDDRINVVAMPQSAAALPSQYPKLWLFSREFADHIGVGRPFLYTDLDVVIVGDVARMTRPGDDYCFRANHETPEHAPRYRLVSRWRRRFVRRKVSAPLNSSFFWHVAGSLPNIWESFDLSHAKRIKGWSGTDQKWISYCLEEYKYFPPSSIEFESLWELDQQGAPPGPDCVAVTCSHKTKPWDPEVVRRNAWLREVHPRAS